MRRKRKVYVLFGAEFQSPGQVSPSQVPGKEVPSASLELLGGTRSMGFHEDVGPAGQ